MGALPAEGAVLPAPPPSIGLTFNEPVSPLVLRLLGPSGKSIDLGKPEVRDDTLTVPLPVQLPRGSYLFSWRIASADGHPVGGTISFAIGAPGSLAVAPAPADRAAGLSPAIAATGLALLAGLLFGIGSVVFDAWGTQYDPGSCRRHLPALLLALVAAPISLGLQGLDALAAPWSALLTRPCWAAAMSTTYGMLVLLAEASALVGLFACVSGSARWRRVLALISMLLLGLALASTGHAATATIGAAAPVAVFLHVAAAAGWLGALACLPLLLSAGYGETALRRFSAAAVVIVIVLVATGLLLAWWQLRAPSDLWRTSYGRILAAKLVLVLGLLMLGARNRWRWTRPVLRGDPGALRALVRNIRWETVLAVGILCAVTLWRFTPPPRALPQVDATSMEHTIPANHTLPDNQPKSRYPAMPGNHKTSGDQIMPADQAMPGNQAMSGNQAMPADQAMRRDLAMPGDRAMRGDQATPDNRARPDNQAPADHAPSGNHATASGHSLPSDPAGTSGHPVSSTLHLHGGGADGQAVIFPKPDGHVRVTLAIMHGNGMPLQAKEMSVRFSNLQEGIEGIVRAAHPAGQGDAANIWVVDDVPLLVAGSWDMKADALISDFDSISLEGKGNIRLGAAVSR
jgi:copper transport protein